MSSPDPLSASVRLSPMPLSRVGVGRAVLVISVLAVTVFAFGPSVEHKLLGHAPPGVTPLDGVDQLAAAFDRDTSSTRLVVIFSPT